MPNNNDYWATPRKDGSWAVKKTGSGRSSSIHDTQADAWKETKRLARGAGSEAFLKGRDGRIRIRNTYGEDHFPPRG